MVESNLIKKVDVEIRVLMVAKADGDIHFFALMDLLSRPAYSS
jgi:hypothetical protein